MADLQLSQAPDHTPSASTSNLAFTSYAKNNYYVYDVFLNHRGPDCKKTLATDLYNRLSKHGLRVFLDQQELQEGDGLTSQIEGAIRTASVHIAIFSPRYAESSWCLKELVLMLESRATIIPVFYGVRPSELRWTRSSNGVYARDLCLLEGKKTFDSQTGQNKPTYDSNTIGKWRNALCAVADISGFDMETYNGDERQLIEQVVERVLKKVPRKLHVSKYPIALDKKVEDFERDMLLQQQNGQARVIGIVGLGGIGKTTLAKEIFNRQRSNYDRSCFLFHVRDNSLESLQSMLLKDLTLWNGQINSTDEGVETLGRYLSYSSKALIILDDVDHLHQMDALLLPAKNALPSGSLIIVTSRDKGVLISWGIVKESIFKLTGLQPQHSQELFCWHAFHQSHPIVGFEYIVNEFLNACNGLPLSLIVIGAHLHGKIDLKYWEAQLRKISKALPSDIQKTLKISYDGLDEEEKQIFLDIACFFIGEDRDRAIRIWDGSSWEGGLGFQNLESKCLVEVDDENQIKMHDHLRDLGRELAEKDPPGCQHRLWRPTHNLLGLSDRSPVRGISMVTNYGSEWPPQEWHWPPQSFRHLAQLTGSLQLLRAEGYYVESILRVAQPPQLTWLCWNKCPYSSLPPWIPTENLRVLQITGNKLETLWSHESQAPLELRELRIHAPKLTSLPKSFGKLINLQHINLLFCFALKRLPESFGKLINLQHINLSLCSALKRLPDSFGELINLQHINLLSCSALKRLPDSFGKLINLQHINLSKCSALKRLPDSFGNLIKLQHLDLSGCRRLEWLSDTFGNLRRLKYLDVGGCDNLTMSNDTLGNISTLEYLSLCWCDGMEVLPFQLANQRSLEILKVNAKSLTDLPSDIGELRNLKELDLCYCYKLKCLPDSLVRLNQLTSLHIWRCDSLEEVPSIERLVSLEYLGVGRCGKVRSIRGLARLTKLRRIILRFCDELKELVGVEHLSSLEVLDVSWCPNLQLPSIERLVSLEYLDVRGSGKVS